VSEQGIIRVLVVDDSAFARKVVRELLTADRRVEVVGTCRDGLEALERIEELKPDVVTLDLIMPHLDGNGVLRALPPGAPAVIVVSMSDEDSELVAEALSLGAADVVKKPTALATARLYEIGSELLAKVIAIGTSRRAAPVAVEAERLPKTAPEARTAHAAQLVVVGASTGGPQALTTLVSGLPDDFPVPVLMALHIPGEYTQALAARLDRASALHVVEATDGLPLQAGLVVLARGGQHLVVERARSGLLARVGELGRHKGYVPSVDALFESAVKACGPHVVGVVLTGMGSDGLAGAQAIRAAGGSIVTEASWSCVVDGMPRSVREAALSNVNAGITTIADELVRLV
jgi:two-component system chemotaxis response regulator CheB